jgi:hypothetical protein
MVERKFHLFLLAAALYFGHNFTNYLLYGYDFILVITFVPYLIVGLVWGLWKRLHPFVIAPILLFLGIIEIPIIGADFTEFGLQTISGVFHVGSIICLLVHGLLLIKRKLLQNRKLKGGERI